MSRVKWTKAIEYQAVVEVDGVKHRLMIVRDPGVTYRLFRCFVDGMLAFKGRDVVSLKKRLETLVTSEGDWRETIQKLSKR